LVKQFLGAVSHQTGYRYMKQFAKEQQKLVSNKEGNEEGNKEGRLRSHVLSRKGYSKVKPHI
jgi:hypothetical protein